jgi:hypothetical protein
MNTMTRPYPWLFSASLDLVVFAGSALLAFAALGVGAALGVVHDDTPDWAWVPAILLVDVAHVWATAFRVYFDPSELYRRPWLYSLTPTLGWLAGTSLYHFAGPLAFWRTLAYLAVFHFVRQQYGWVALYRARAGETDRLGQWIDSAAIYLATLYPLAWWHAHLDGRHFKWFVPGDFVAVLPWIADVLAPLYVLALTLYALRAAWLWHRGQPNPGKDLVVLTTALCWYVGIVALNSDFAFTMTNVLIHGIPYFALVFWFWRQQTSSVKHRASWLQSLTFFLSLLWVLAYLEELLWDRAVWHDRPWLFGPPWHAEDVAGWLVPLLAVPQLTHYILDGFIWRRRSNPTLSLWSDAAPR